MFFLTSCLSSSVEKYFRGAGISTTSKQPYKEVVEDSMKDPEAVRYRKLRFYNPKRNGRRITVMCGEFNAKNSMGGYTGYSDFVSNGITYDDDDYESRGNLGYLIVECLCRNGEIPDRCK